MRRPTLVSGLAEEFGIGVRGSGSAYLRSALEGPPYDEAEKEPHARSTVWTAAGIGREALGANLAYSGR